MAFIGKVVTFSGATVIQIAHKQHGRIVKIELIGSAYKDKDIQSLVPLAKLQLQGSQQTLSKDPVEPLGLALSKPFPQSC